MESLVVMNNKQPSTHLMP